MGNDYDHHLHQHPHRPTFLPMLCSRPSIKDVSLPSWRDHSRSASFSDDPLSPKISCMGQVKRNNKIVGLPATFHHKFTITTTPGRTTHIHNINVKYFKLRKLFSGKNLTTTTSAAAVAASGFKSCGKREGTINCEKGRSDSDSIQVSIEELDPPLPVIKRAPKPQGEREERETLWKRRSGGAALGSLQVKEIQLTRNHLAPPTDTATV